MVRTFLIFIVSTMSCFSQGTGFGFRSVSFMSPTSTAAAPPYTNGVQWLPAAKTIDWMSATGGLHSAENLATFETNDVSDIVGFFAVGSAGNYITNFSGLRNMQSLYYLKIQSCNGLETLDVDRVGQDSITNITIDQNPNLYQLYFETAAGHGAALYYINLSHNASLTNIDDTGWSYFDSSPTTFLLDNCSLSDDPDNVMINASCKVWDYVSGNSVSNGTFAIEGNAAPLADTTCADGLVGYGWTVTY